MELGADLVHQIFFPRRLIEALLFKISTSFYTIPGMFPVL